MNNRKIRIAFLVERVKIKFGTWLNQSDTRLFALIFIVILFFIITYGFTDEIGWFRGITMFVIIFGVMILILELLNSIIKQEPKKARKRWEQKSLPFVTLFMVTVKEVMICYLMLLIVVMVSVGLINQVFPPIEWTVTNFAWTILAISAFTYSLFCFYTKNKIGEKLARLAEGSERADDEAVRMEIEEGRIVTLLEVIAMVATVVILSISVFKPFEINTVLPENFLEVPENQLMNLTIATYIPTIYYKLKAMNK